jgi:thiamine biosynthesis lipoprotein
MLTFRAMNTDVAVIANPEVALAVAHLFAVAEQRFSRFRTDSELAHLNRSTLPIRVSPEMFDALVQARRYVELTDGIFDPAIGAALVALGYDRSFEPGALDRDVASVAPSASTFLAVELDVEHREVTRPAELQIDLGGMIKGRTVDAAAALLPVTGGAINAGGDAVLRGPRGWRVEIEDPREPSRIVSTIRVCNAAVATSAANRRHWNVAGEQRHHIVDPRTQRSAATDVLQVTIVAPLAELADVLAKVVFVVGAVRGAALIERLPDVGAIMIAHDGSITQVGSVEVVS